MAVTSLGSDDGLPALRAKLMETTQTLLAQAGFPQIDFLTCFAEFMAASRALSEGLLNAVPKVSQELGEAYIQEGEALRSYPEFLIAALSEHRKRRGIE